MIYNFSAGPAMLDPMVLQQARDELLDWQGSGMSVLEMSHRGPQFERIIAEAETDLRSLLDVPNHYKLLFMQAGGYGQFAAVPLNLASRGQSADYVVSGSWSKAAAQEAAKYVSVRVAGNGESDGFRAWPSEISVNGEAAYIYLCSNETVHGVEMHELPMALRETNTPIVCDASSHFLSRPLRVSDYGLVFAGAQKNVGPSGVTLVLVREDLLERARDHTPSVLHYATLAKHGSMHNTPPTFGIYLAGLTAKQLLKTGGLVAAEARNVGKAEALYAAIDQSEHFRCPVNPANRSRMNVVFTSGDKTKDAQFAQFCESRGLIQLTGHRSVGGLRASLYNAMPRAGVDALVTCLLDFERGARS